MRSVHLLGDLYQISGRNITEYEDAAAYALINDDNEALLIDIGSLESYRKVMGGLGAIGVEACGIKLVLPTHIHRDHVSGMAELVKEEGCETEFFVHPLERQAVESGDYNMTAGFLYGKESPPIKADRELKDGDVIKWGSAIVTAVHVPSHSPGSMLYRIQQPEGTVDIAGDAMWGLFHPNFGSSIEAWVKSLNEMYNLPEADGLTFGHEISHLVRTPRACIEKAIAQFNPELLPPASEFPDHEPVDIWGGTQARLAAEKAA
jgi:glyoxylase-like metal-dependent hydrolase (beta-lactamase superfamily II)